MLVEIAAQNADTTTVNLWIDALKVNLGSEHTHAVFKCMQEAYLAGTKAAYASLRAKIWLTRSSRNTAQYQLALRSNACSTLLDILENDINCQAAYSRHLLQKEMISVANEGQSNNDRLHVDAIAYYYLLKLIHSYICYLAHVTYMDDIFTFSQVRKGGSVKV
jgi:hypothetical protein